MIRYPVRQYEPLKAELEAFVRSVVDGKPVSVDDRDGLVALRLAVAKSGETHQIVEID